MTPIEHLLLIFNMVAAGCAPISLIITNNSLRKWGCRVSAAAFALIGIGFVAFTLNDPDPQRIKMKWATGMFALAVWQWTFSAP
ncbi:MAG: hypothetical protein WDN46_10155 [Methylocella sp.]